MPTSPITQPLLPMFAPNACLANEGEKKRVLLRSDRGELSGATAMVRVSTSVLADKDFRLACLQGFGPDHDAMLTSTIDGSAYLVAGPRLTIRGERPVPGSTLSATTVDGTDCGDLHVRSVYRGELRPSILSAQHFRAADIEGIVKIKAPPPAPLPCVSGLPLLVLAGLALALSSPNLLVQVFAATGAIAGVAAIATIVRERARAADSKRAACAVARREDAADEAQYGTGIREESTTLWSSSTPIGSGSPGSPSSLSGSSA